METRYVIAEVQAGEHEEEETGDDAGTGESVFRWLEAKVKFKETNVTWEISSARSIWSILGARPLGLADETGGAASRFG